VPKPSVVFALENSDNAAPCTGLPCGGELGRGGLPRVPMSYRQGVTRRRLIRCAAGLTAGVALSRLARGALPPAATRRLPVRVGIFLSTFGGKPFEAQLDGVKAAGLDCVQLSMDCLGMAPMPDRIEAAVIERIKRAASGRGIEIVSLQGTFNMGHPDAEFRAGGVRRLGVLATAAREMGTKLIHICTGTRDRVSMWRRHPRQRNSGGVEGHVRLRARCSGSR